MLKVADRAQQGFFDASVCGSIIPQESIYALLAEHGERIVSDEDFAECYSDSRGRPSIPPSLLSKVMLLAYREGSPTSSGGGDAKAKPKTLAVSLENKFSGQLDRVEQDLRPVLSEQGAEGTAYRVEEGSARCREQDGGPAYVCLVWLVDGEGTRFSLAYSLTSADDGWWKASP